MTIGESLKRARTKLNLDLDEVAERTKIAKMFLIALEEDDISRLPSGVYARNFLRTYAKFLQLDEDILTTEYHDQFQIKPHFVAHHEQTKQDDALFRKNRRKVYLGVFILILIVAAVVYVFFVPGGEKIRDWFGTTFQSSSSEVIEPEETAQNTTNPASTDQNATVTPTDSLSSGNEAVPRESSESSNVSTKANQDSKDTDPEASPFVDEKEEADTGESKPSDSASGEDSAPVQSNNVLDAPGDDSKESAEGSSANASIAITGQEASLGEGVADQELTDAETSSTEHATESSESDADTDQADISETSLPVFDLSTVAWTQPDCSSDSIDNLFAIQAKGYVSIEVVIDGVVVTKRNLKRGQIRYYCYGTYTSVRVADASLVSIQDGSEFRENLSSERLRLSAENIRRGKLLATFDRKIQNALGGEE